MRPLLLISALCVVSLTARAESSWTKLLPIQYGLIDQLEPLSQSGEYAAIYELLDSEYRSVVSEENFVRTSKELSWQITELQSGTSNTRKHFAWAPVRCTVVLGSGKKLIVNSVVFFRKEDGKWKFVNFPFVSPGFPNFGAIPEWVQKADEIYENE